MKYICLIAVFLTISLSVYPQSIEKEVLETIKNYQEHLNEQFLNPETSILLKEDFLKFEGLNFYPINLKFRVEASLIKTPNEKPFRMQTTTERLPWYVKYGELHFSIDGKDFILDIFQNLEPKTGYEDYIFLPFTDLTSGNGSYGGGRYIDLKTSDDTTIILDFNKSYNPYCAYNPAYSCPIPPEQNDLKIRIEAGVRDFSSF